MHQFSLGNRSMRHPIETVPKDGTTVILEDDTSGTYELARWSAQECAWVAQDGRPYKGTPTYWHAIQRAEHPDSECKSTEAISPNLRSLEDIEQRLKALRKRYAELDKLVPLRNGVVDGAEPQRAPALADVFAPPPATSSEPVSISGKQMPRDKAQPSPARRRFAACCGAAMIAAALTGMYFRGDVVAYAAKHADRSGELRAGSVPRGSPEQPRIISLARNSSGAGSAPASAGKVTVGRAPTQSPEDHRRADAMDKELLDARQALAEAQQRETQLNETAETARTELQQSLDKIASLENELATARQHTDPASLSPPPTRRIPQRRVKQPDIQGFFGIFTAGPNRAPVQRSARIPDDR
jgi:hypothetical protein